MLELLKKLQEKIDARIIRERILIFISALVVVFVLWDSLVQAPFNKKKQNVQTQIKEVTAQRIATQEQINLLTQASLNDPSKIKQEQIKQLEVDIAQVEAQLQNVSQGLIKAEQLPQVLQEALQKTTQLTLLEATTFPARELLLASASTPANTNVNEPAVVTDEAQHAGIYEHVVELRVAGNYFQVVQFLTALEALPWRFYWQRLDYKVTEYPHAEIILRVYTLSTEEGLLGV